jgi:hypothetical protein
MPFGIFLNKKNRITPNWQTNAELGVVEAYR